MRTRLVLAVVPALFVLAGCEQLTATMQAVSVFTRAPSLAQAEDMDDGLTAVLPLDALAAPDAAAVAVAVGEKASPTSTNITPYVGATVTLSFAGNAVRVCSVTEPGAEGTYAATSIDAEPCGDSSLEYTAGAVYTTEIETGSDVYSVTVTAPPAINAGAVVFAPQLSVGADIYGYDASLPGHGINSALTVDWSGDAAAAERHAIITLFRISFVGDTTDPTAALEAASWQADAQNPVFDNAPRTLEQMLPLITDKSEGKVAIPATAFSSAGLYFLVITPIELSTSTSDNLAIGSGALAGAGTAFVFWVD